jgi:demethylmenaquinone methyltransferase/2-methoxy-6-polyprenyl-1,4-benzoquinol methylase
MPCGRVMMGDMTDDVLAEQVDYYRSRADEYDETAYGDLELARRRIARIVDDLDPGGHVLEIACGTGMWTQALARVADTVTAVDAAPEAVALARRRVVSDTVEFEVADVFSWSTEQRFDVIFFAAWLSHVPASRFAEFWGLLAQWLAPGGRVLFVDEHVDVREKESYVAGEVEIIERRLGDGRTYRIVKVFVDPEGLEAMLRPIGWQCRLRRDGDDWVVGEARPGQDPVFRVSDD